MAAGRFECPCERQKRVEETCLPSARLARPWHWEDPSKPNYRGCGDQPAKKSVTRFGGTDLFRCPSREVEPWAWDVLFLWRSWENGLLPDSGGVSEQSAPLLDALRVVGSAVAEEHERQREAAELSSKAQAASMGQPRRRG